MILIFLNRREVENILIPHNNKVPNFEKYQRKYENLNLDHGIIFNAYKSFLYSAVIHEIIDSAVAVIEMALISKPNRSERFIESQTAFQNELNSFIGDLVIKRILKLKL